MLRSAPWTRAAPSERGQALTEFALVAPVFTMVIVGIVVLGFGLFLQQEVTNVAREGARYAILHSATAQCPTVSNLVPNPVLLSVPNNYFACDSPDRRWPFMTAAARENVFGMNRAALRITACWSGYWQKDAFGNWVNGSNDEPPTPPNEFRPCTLPVYGWSPGQDPDVVPATVHTIDPRTGRDAGGNHIKVDCSQDFPLTTSANDMASNFSSSGGNSANQVTVFACYQWNPPLAGFLLIPRTTVLTGVISEAMQYQQ
jgi:hypothetical protein